MSPVAFFAAVFFGAGIFMVAYGIHAARRVQTKSLRELLEVELADPSGSPEALTDLMQRAGAFAERAIRRTSFGDRISRVLNQAAWSLKPGEFAAVLASTSILAAVTASFWTGSMVAGMLAAIAVPAGMISWVGHRARRRLRQVEQQLPSMLQLLATSLDAGSSVLNALRLVAEEGDPPLAQEFSRVVAETSVGRPTIESLEHMAQRVGSREFDWTVEAIRIQTQSGGKLADTLRVLAEFLRDRLEVKGEVQALSAEARLSAKVLTALPFLLGGYLFMFRRSYMEPLLTSAVGRQMLVVAALGIGLGTIWMRRMVRVEV